MIIQRHKGEILAIKQEDHAAFAGFLLEHWSDHRFSRDANREDIIFATRMHDNGWREYDEAPRLNKGTGIPVDFRHVNAEEAYEVWMRGTNRYLEERPFVALLIAHHGYSLHEHAHNRDGIWKKFFVELAQIRGELRTKLELTHNALEHSYSFLRMMDWYSLAYCMDPEVGKEKPQVYAGYKFKRNGPEYLFRPYPFDTKNLSYTLPVYRLDPEGYKTEKALRKALAEPEPYEITLNPLRRSKR